MRLLITLGFSAFLMTGTVCAQAQQPSASPLPTASPAPAPRNASMTMPKGWIAAPGDSVAKFVYRSPTAPQDIRVAPVAAAKELTGEQGMKTVRAMMARFKTWQADVTQTMVCNGAEPAILSVAKDEKGQTVMEQVIVVGTAGGAIVTYEIRDGHPDPQAESALRSICIP